MALSDFKPTLRNDLSLYDKDIYDNHKQLIQQGRYSQAKSLLQSNPKIHGGLAEMLNEWENKIVQLGQMIDQAVFNDPYVHSRTEPTESQMAGKTIWEQEY